jgi:NADPH-dependent glutamate synthase beta subunit-like oxidoreductase/NAD-dependent dihydropyrimidine dehydrogenase PreA subunit
MIKITIDGQSVEVPSGTSILDAANKTGIYIPVLCKHPELQPFRSLILSDIIYQGNVEYKNDPGSTMESILGCGLCIVEIEGKNEPVPSCKTEAEDGMVILTDTDSLKLKRQKKLIPVLANHPHSCLTCSQRGGCLTLTADCSNSVNLNDRCCEINGNCEFQRLVDYVGIAPETPKFHHKGIPRIYDGDLIVRDYNLCIACGRCVRACQQLRNVFALGAVVHEGKLVVGTVNGPNLSDADCRFCGACVEVCPTGAIQDAKKPRLKEFKDYLPCRANCPGDTDIPAYLKYIADGDYQSSADVISSKLSFPNTLGKVCFHPCETECRREYLSQSINNKPGALSIRLAKDAAMSRAEMKSKDRLTETGKKVSVIGAGPAGLTTAFYLSLKGHKVIVYEKEEKIGGMLRYGIPRYRLPESTLDRDLNWLLESGIEVKSGVNVGDDITLSDMLNDSFDAVYLATGLSKSKQLPIEIPKNDSIHYGVEFLKKVEKHIISGSFFKGHNVLVIGGGNVATDAARTAIRLGADNVKLICLEKRNEMPAYEQEIEESLEEGIGLMNGWGISGISLNKKIELTLIKCTRVFDENGRFSPKYDENITETIDCNSVIICIGQEADTSCITDEEKNKILDKGLIKTKIGSFETPINGLFAGGDIVSGPKSVIDAIGASKQAAREIDKFLGGNGIISGDDRPDVQLEPKIGKIDGFCRFERVPVRLMDANVRKNSFEGVELGYSDEEARFETARCLQCNLRMTINHNPYPPEDYFDFTIENIENVPQEEGVVQLLDKDKESFLIKGSVNIQKTLKGFLDEGKDAKYFSYELDKLFSQRESELVGQYLQKHGKMPDSGDDFDDLF